MIGLQYKPRPRNKNKEKKKSMQSMFANKKEMNSLELSQNDWNRAHSLKTENGSWFSWLLLNFPSNVP